MKEDSLTDGRIEGRFYVSYEGESLPVTNLFSGPEAVTEPALALSFVAGPTSDGYWISAETAVFEIHEGQPQ